MPLQNFVDKSLPAVSAAWLNQVDTLKFTIFGDAATKTQARTALTSDLPLEVVNGGTGSRSAVLSTGVSQIFSGVDSGAVNAYVVALTPNPALIAGITMRFTPLNTNTGPSTINGAAVTRANGTALTGGELSSAGPTLLQYTGTQWQILATAGAQPGFERTAAEVSNAVIPLSYNYLPGDVRRQGVNGDGGVTDNTPLLQNALTVNAGLVTYVPNMGNFAKLLGRVTAPANTTVRMGAGAELRWTATTATGTVFLGAASRPGIEVMGDKFVLEGKGKITGPATAAAGSGAGGGGTTAVVANEFAILRVGASAANRGTGFVVRDVEISLWGQEGIVTQYIQDSQIIGCTVHDVAYAGIHQFSARGAKEYFNTVYGIAPGISANAYGISHTHDSTNYNTDPLVNSTVTAITQANPAVATINVVSGSNPYAVGQSPSFFGISGMTQINGQSAAISAIGGVSGAWTLTLPINAAGFSPFVASAVITNITQAAGAVVTISTVSVANPYAVGMAVNISGVNGMVQINGTASIITAIGGVSGAWTITINRDTTSFTAYTSAGTVSSNPSISLPRQATNPFCIDMDCAFNQVRDIPSWIAFDAHGCYDGRYHHNTVYNCHRGMQISSSSGAAGNYAGDNNEITNNKIHSEQINGNPTTDVLGFQGGIIINGGSLTSPNGTHRNVLVADNDLVGLGHASAAPSIYCLEASLVENTVIRNNKFRNCVGRGIYGNNFLSGVISQNQFGAVGASAVGSACIYLDSGYGTGVQVVGNSHNYVTGQGTQVPYAIGFILPSPILRIISAGNDFALATTPYNSVAGQFTKGLSDFTPAIFDAVTGSHTVDVSVCGLAPRIFIRASQSAIATLTSLLNPQMDGQEVIIVMTGASTLTVNDAGNIRLLGGTAALTQQSSLTLAWSSTLTLWIEAGRALGAT